MAFHGSALLMEEVDVLVEDVHTRAAQMDEVMTQVRDNCQGFISKAKLAADNIMAEAEKQSNAMKAEIADWEEQKKRIASTKNFESTVSLNVGGHLFTTTTQTLTRFPDTLLGEMFSGCHALVEDKNGAYFIDRDGRNFYEILNFLRSPDTFDNSGLQGRLLTELKLETEYYGLKSRMFPTPQELPFVPAEPVKVSTITPSRKVTISQDNDQLWYMQLSHPSRLSHSSWSPSKGYYTPTLPASCDPIPVTICDGCGFGWPEQHPNCGVVLFTSGRTISDAQPRKIGGCSNCVKAASSLFS